MASFPCWRKLPTRRWDAGCPIEQRPIPERMLGRSTNPVSITSGPCRVSTRFAGAALAVRVRATGYCDPLLVSIQHGYRKFAQILHPRPLADIPNPKRKEDGMIAKHLEKVVWIPEEADRCRLTAWKRTESFPR